MQLYLVVDNCCTQAKPNLYVGKDESKTLEASVNTKPVACYKWWQNHIYWVTRLPIVEKLKGDPILSGTIPFILRSLH